MSTWWTPATRADLGLRVGDLSGNSLTVTNRGWRVLHQILTTVGARQADRLAEPDTYVPGTLAGHWGGHLLTADGADWLQIGRWDGRAVTSAGIVHRCDAARYADLYELTPLQDTPIAPWLNAIGQHLITTPTGLHLTGRPHKENKMTVNLSKGGKVDLTKEAGGTLTKVRVGLGWDARKTAGAAYDLDASAVGLGENGFCVTTDWFVYYNNPASPGDAIVHQGDNLTGTGTGDDEQILVDLAKLPDAVADVRFVVTSPSAASRTRSSASSTKPPAPNWPATTCPRTPSPASTRSCSPSCTATTAPGTSGPSATDSPMSCRASSTPTRSADRWDCSTAARSRPPAPSTSSRTPPGRPPST
jgi:hypothetical protein